MTKRGTRGQAAFEYIVIYGWATLIILGSIGVLYSFDLLNFNGFLGDKCTFYGQATCFESQVISDPVSDMGNITIVLQNEFGTDLVIEKVQVLDDYFNCSAYTPPDLLWGENQRVQLNITGCGGATQDFVEGSRTDSTVILSYYRNISICNDIVTGDVVPECILETSGSLKQTIREPYD